MDKQIHLVLQTQFYDIYSLALGFVDGVILALVLSILILLD